MTDNVETKLLSIPPVKGGARMTLDQVIGLAGVKAIETAGALIFHVVGDTGNEYNSMQEL